MIYWPHNGDISKPPEIEDLRYRKPDKDYWESKAGDRRSALPNLWNRWKRETGKKFPRQIPNSPQALRVGVINRVGSDRRVDRQKAKDKE